MTETPHYQHNDVLNALNEHKPLREKLITAHEVVKQRFPFIQRISLTLYDPETSVLKTYMHSSGNGDPLAHYQTLLDEAPSLKKIIEQNRPRVVNNMVTFEDGSHEHTRRIGRHGYAASYTMPMYNNGVFFGFLFFNSDTPDVFTELTLREIDVFGHMIALMVISELNSVHTLTAAVKTAGNIVHVRDPETGSHIDRMSRYSRMIATHLANDHELDDIYIEHVFMFAPLHDIGKVAIPDDILLKKGALTEEETRIMQTHSRVGREMIDEIVNNFGLESIENVDILRNIAEFHHEAVNGSGYPDHLSDGNIPLEARIVAVADVFDALTSKRPYKEAWSNDQAFAMLQKLAGEKLDTDCVQALMDNREAVEDIQRRFREDEFG
ncbi:MAG: HD domain-containing protein [Granulosicoccaceae bacterium]